MLEFTLVIVNNFPVMLHKYCIYLSDVKLWVDFCSWKLKANYLLSNFNLVHDATPFYLGLKKLYDVQVYMVIWSWKFHKILTK